MISIKVSRDIKIFCCSRLQIKEKLFSKTGDLKIKCTATIDTIYWRSNEESIQDIQENSFSKIAKSGFWNTGDKNDTYNRFPNILFQLLIPFTVPHHHYLYHSANHHYFGQHC